MLRMLLTWFLISGAIAAVVLHAKPLVQRWKVLTFSTAMGAVGAGLLTMFVLLF